MKTAKYPSREPEYQRAYFRIWRERNRNKIREYNKARAEKRRVAFRDRYASDPDFRERHKETQRRLYPKMRAKAIARAKAWTAANRERKNANKRRRYREAHDHFISKSRIYCATRKATGKAAQYREQTRVRQREWARARAAEAGDAYAREQLSKYSAISASDWPQELVEAKKIQIQLKRLIRKSA